LPSRRWLRSLTLVLAVAACAAPAKAPETPPVDPAALKDAIQAREKEWSAAYLAGNGAGIAALYTEDGASIQPAGDSWNGRAAIEKAMQAQLDTVVVSTREDIAEEVTPAGDKFADEWTFTGTNSGPMRSFMSLTSGRQPDDRCSTRTRRNLKARSQSASQL